MDNSTKLNVIFSGLVVLEGSRRSARIGLLRPAPSHPGKAGHGGHGALGAHAHPGHRPLLVVRTAQVISATATRVSLTDLILKEWLAPNPIGEFEGISLAGKDVVFEAAGSGGLKLEPPSTHLRCPNDDFSDLGWLVNFGHKHPGIVLDANWDQDSHVAAAITLPDHGTVTGAAPLDALPDGSFHRFVFGTGGQLREQAYTDAFRWSTAVVGEVTMRLIDREGGPEHTVTLASTGQSPDLYILNHPENLDLEDPPGKHVELVYDLPLLPPPEDRDPPTTTGMCHGGQDAGRVEPVQPPLPPVEGSALGKTYCAACLLWNE